MAGQTHSADVIIIGAGIAGASVAAHLAASLRVVLVEMESQPGYHTTGRSAAVFAPSYGPEAVRALTRASRGFYDQPPEGFASEALLTPRQILMIARADQLAALESSIAAAATGTRVQRLDASGLRDHQPLLREGYATAGMLDCGGQDIDVAALHQGYLRLFRARGGVTRTKAAVEGLKREGDTWVVRTSGQDHMTAPVIVNAAGAWADQIAGMAGIAPLGILPHRRSMARLPAPGGHDVSQWPMFFGVGESWYAKPDAGALLVSPAEEDLVEPHDAWADDMVLAEGLARYEEMVTEPVTRLLTSWAGLRSFSPDRALVLGPEPGDPAFVWCAAQGGYGFQTAPAASQLLADLVMGRTPALPGEIVASLTPDRFRR